MGVIKKPECTSEFKRCYFLKNILILHTQVSPSEVSRLLTCMTGDTFEAKQGGITVGGQNFIFMHSDSRSVYGRKGVDAGVCAVKCHKAMLIGIYAPGIQPENCNAVILKLADYLMQHNL